MTIMWNENVVLRPFTDKDKQTLAKLCNNKNIWNNLRDYVPFPYSEDDADFFINLCQSEVPVQNYAITYKGELAGSVGLIPQKDVHRLSAEVGYWVGEDYWGKGIATEAVKLITMYGKKEFGLMRFYAGVYEYNKASMRVLEKAGFTLEGIFKKSIIKNGIIADEHRYGLVIE